MNKSLRTMAVALAAIAFTVAPAFGATFSASAGNFDFSLADDTSWGIPTVVGANNNTLVFNGASFNVDSTTTPTAGDSVGLTINADPGFSLSVVNVTAFGSYDLNGETSSVNFQLDLTALDLNQGGTEVSQQAASSPGDFPRIAGDTDPVNVNNQSFSVVNTLDISSALGFLGNNVLLTLDAATAADGGTMGGTSSLNFNVSAMQLQFNFIPEPATLSLLGLGAIALIRRRR